VTTPFKLKFSSSRGPIASDAGGLAVVLVAGAVLSWASAGSGANASAIANAATPKRKPALISFRSLL
jgi:hypothetical protein